ncbi:MAG: double-strand break repair protein AddB, partial [Pseudomonadota bacterium]
MFERSATPRVFSAPPGADFPRDVIAGLHTRLGGRPPEAWADIRILANAGRMLRRLLEVLEDGEARIFPRLSLITDLAALSPFLGAAESVHPLRRELDLARDLERISGLSSRASVAHALAALLDEMAEEGVAPEALEALDISDQSGHWQRALAILKVAADFERGPGPGQAARRAAQHLAAQWQARPPATPILVAGSTGSRGVTALVMEAVARLPQGALILPGFDHAMPADVWAELASDAGQEDHPQYRYAALLRRLRLDPLRVEPWNAVPAPRPGRARLLSLALRPAPVTHHWLRDGPDLDDIAQAVECVTLLEASDQKAEANTIALRMRQAAETGETAALITPDRTLTRRVAAALARWKLVADDSAGIPLSLTPPGRLLLQLAQIKAKGIASETLIALLKHPLVASSERGPHLLFTRALELKLRRVGPPFPTP